MDKILAVNKIWYENLVGTYFQYIPDDILTIIKAYKPIFMITMSTIGCTWLSTSPKYCPRMCIGSLYVFSPVLMNSNNELQYNYHSLCCYVCKECFIIDIREKRNEICSESIVINPVCLINAIKKDDTFHIINKHFDKLLFSRDIKIYLDNGELFYSK